MIMRDTGNYSIVVHDLFIVHNRYKTKLWLIANVLLGRVGVIVVNFKEAEVTYFT